MVGWEEDVDTGERRAAVLLSLLVNARGPLPVSHLASLSGEYSEADDAAVAAAIDVDHLRALGLRVDLSGSGPDSVISLARASWEPRPLRLSDPESALLEQALAEAGPPEGRLAEAVAVLRSPGAPEIADTTVSLSPRTTSVAGHQEVYSRLHRLAGQSSSGIVSKFGYPDQDGAVAERHVCVYALGRSRGVWYAVGPTPGDDTIRAFALAEMHGPVADSSGEGAFVAPHDFSASPYLVMGWRLGPEPFEATVRFDASLAPFITASLPDAPHEVRTDGAIDTTVDVGDLERFVGWVLSFGTHARVLSPDHAVSLAVESLRIMAASDD